MTTQTRTPNLEEVEAIIQQARRERALLITGLLRRLFHRPARTPLATVHTT
jgi:hypothetical protein